MVCIDSEKATDKVPRQEVNGEQGVPENNVRIMKEAYDEVMVY